MKIIFVVSEDWYFVSHRLALARELVLRGHNVMVVTQVNGTKSGGAITAAGCRIVPLALRRGAIGSFHDLFYLGRLILLYRRERPQIVHHVAMKPVLYGSIAALFCSGVGVVNAIAGMGSLFLSEGRVARMARFLVTRAFAWLFARPRVRVVLQNAEDAEFFHSRLRVPSCNVSVVKGVGVNVSSYPIVRHGHRLAPVVIMVSRALRDKGVREFVMAAAELRTRFPSARFLLVGAADEKNPSSLTSSELQRWAQTGVIEWLGHRTDIAELNDGSDIAVLPSYREGLPKSLVEAASCGLPIVTTNTSGCREVVTHEWNGLLVPTRDAASLAVAIGRLLESPELRQRFGAASRRRAEEEFTEQRILGQMVAIYGELAQKPS